MYRLLLRFGSIFHRKARQMVIGRNNWRNALQASFKENDHPVAWFHCASLGEFEQGRSLIEEFNRAYPKYRILLTFYSPSGYEIRKDYPIAYAVHYLPWDTAANARFFMQTVKPKIGFLIKYEYWYHILKNAQAQAIPIMLCSAIFRSEQIFFKPYGRLFRRILSYFDHIFVQNARSKELLNQLSISNVTVAGDTRMDRVREITLNSKSNAIVAQFVEQSSTTMIIGSSWPEDIQLLAPIINGESEMKFIIAPHEINAKHLTQIDRLITRPLCRYTEAESNDSCDVLVIDTIGMLSHLYQYGDYAYIGGALGKGLHNILEAATFGLPLFFGNKKFSKFREARKLVTLSGAQPVGNTKELLENLNHLRNNPDRYQEVSDICHKYVMEQTGATKVIMDYTHNILN